MAKASKLVLITGSFPFPAAAENTFVLPELPYLAAIFRSVYVFPEDASGEACDLSSLSNVTVDTRLSEYLRRPLRLGFLLILFRYLPALIQELAYGKLPLSLSAMKTKVRTWVSAVRRAAFLCTCPEADGASLYYTYWFDGSTLALALLGRKPLISRAHGYDLYEERRSEGIIPFRSYVLSRLQHLFLVSQAGLEYMVERYPRWKYLYSAAPIGVDDRGMGRGPSMDGVIRILSCSYVVELKRVDLILESIRALAAKHPSLNIRWYHIGDGPLLSSLTQKAEMCEENLEATFMGRMSPSQISTFYDEAPIDLFVHLSSTEGGRPIAICEAISRGIPVVACNVGGIPEIVSHLNGALLALSVDPERIADTCYEVLTHREYAAMRTASRKTWESSANLHRNMEGFSAELHRLIL